ncbi:hypothetical protein [Niabella ginsengisoli]|uniref:DUF4274 domain-containing protein n=1 Tax=Niabella ginsengisoli TaxID=522298 RepID=A0ABS9SHX7_9BACT|nr:hypothetical protein [Niabella ginsengisoli]MCH5597973.1 hypothetical protein [Niabella ginsengisoli]
MKTKEEILSGLNYTRNSEEYKIIKTAFWGGNIMNLILGKYPYRIYEESANINASQIVWTFHAMLIDNEISIEKIDKEINNIEITESNVCQLLYFIYLCKIKQSKDDFLVFHYSKLYEIIKERKELFKQIKCYDGLIYRIDSFG